MKRLIFIASLVLIFTACDRSGQGHLTGVQNRPDGFYGDPPGMVYIPMGSFNMGPSDQDVAYGQSAITKTISLPSFYMDETEITNNQYRQFVYWVRDSLAHMLLADINEDHLILMDEFGMDLDPPLINWRQRISWDGEEEREVLDELFLPEHERFFRRREVDTRKLIYRYHIIDLNRAARRSERNTPRNEFVVEYETHIYPDTLAWIHDFSYAYNEPMTQQYFWHPTFDHYPVVGVNWLQARAFTIWRTQFLNNYLSNRTRPFAMDFRLPTEAEWEYAARGGLDLNPYPWGGPYTRNLDGCFLANFKPLRGNYVDDGGFQTIIVGHYPPNDFGLYDMAGNVSEWTINAWDESFYNFGHDMNMHYHYEARPEDPITLKRKAIRGGSWKDVGYMLQVSTRTWEYQDTAKSYIGFRCVQTYPGRDRADGRRSSNVY
jgi:formylglycine-generating enzyme